MDVVLIFNGLGNQMSQYAFFLSKKRYVKHCRYLYFTTRCSHNGSELDKLFHVNFPQTFLNSFLYKIYSLYDGVPKIRKYLHLIGIRCINEDEKYTYEEEVLFRHTKWGITFYVGGWHSEKYFAGYESEIKDTFQFNIEKEEEAFSLLADKISKDPNSVSVHVRRGDYLKSSPTDYYQFAGVATENYYHQAFQKMESIIENPIYYVFSDDIAWCKKHFGNIACHYVDINKRDKSWRDMFLMSLCHYHINANSSFSWWGAWLGRHDHSVTICPGEFIRGIEIKDVYPETWIRINRKLYEP